MRTSVAPWVGLIWPILFCLACGKSSPAGPQSPPPPSEPEPHQLAFVAQPSGVALGVPLTPAITVEVRDAAGQRIPSAAVTVELALESNVPDASLRGSRSVVSSGGLASFTDLVVDRSGTFSLRATSGTLSAISTAFTVTYTFRAIGESRVISACGWTAADLLLCWGINLGGFGFSASDEPRPIQLPAAVTAFDPVWLGSSTSCGLAGDQAYCWGDNGSGQLGIGEFTNGRTRPSKVVGGHAFEELAVGQAHVCGRTTVGDVYCWGAEQSGDGSHASANAPTLVQGGVRFASIATKGGYTCGIALPGDTYCWNAEFSGDGTIEFARQPRLVAGGHSFGLLAPGLRHACALDAQDHAWCWGENLGRLGDGTDEVRLEPVAVQGNLRFRSLSAGDAHTCGVDFDDLAWCWGLNFSGELGNPAEQIVRVPVAVEGGLRFEFITASLGFTCGLTRDGGAWCWGDNTQGTLGIGSMGGISAVPVRVAEPTLR